MMSAKNLTNTATCHTVWETYRAPKMANCDECFRTHHSSDPALNQAVDGLRRIIHHTRMLDMPPCGVTSDPTAPQAMGRFLLAEVAAR
jgi:hypothetical protein